jgi:hypothetical protein
MKRNLTVRIEEEEYINIKIKLLKDKKSFQQYVMDLIRKDMVKEEE